MFIGLIDEFNEAIPPTVISRVPSEDVMWAVQYAALNRVSISNLNTIQMRVYEDIQGGIPKISLFREIDDTKPFIPITDMHQSISRPHKGDFIAIGQGGLTMSLNFRDNMPSNLEVYIERVDTLKDEATQHLDFIHKIAFEATGDLRAMARLYIKNWARTHPV